MSLLLLASAGRTMDFVQFPKLVISAARVLPPTLWYVPIMAGRLSSLNPENLWLALRGRPSQLEN
jgi:hypothetical protein